MSHEHDSGYRYLFSAPDLGKMMARWIRATLMRKSEYHIFLPQVDELQEINVMLADRLEEWAHQYEARGESRGESLALQKLLTKRFGVIPPDVMGMIAAASKEQIEAWFDVAIDASSYDEVFGPHMH